MSATPTACDRCPVCGVWHRASDLDATGVWRCCWCDAESAATPPQAAESAPMPVVTAEEHAVAVRFDAELMEQARPLPWCRSCGGVP